MKRKKEYWLAVDWYCPLEIVCLSKKLQTVMYSMVELGYADRLLCKRKGRGIVNRTEKWQTVREFIEEEVGHSLTDKELVKQLCKIKDLDEFFVGLAHIHRVEVS